MSAARAVRRGANAANQHVVAEYHQWHSMSRRCEARQTTLPRYVRVSRMRSGVRLQLHNRVSSICNAASVSETMSADLLIQINALDGGPVRALPVSPTVRTEPFWRRWRECLGWFGGNSSCYDVAEVSSVRLTAFTRMSTSSFPVGTAATCGVGRHGDPTKASSIVRAWHR
jgi:hypothetical protein